MVAAREDDPEMLYWDKAGGFPGSFMGRVTSLFWSFHSLLVSEMFTGSPKFLPWAVFIEPVI
jgi:hypothetical protein